MTNLTAIVLVTLVTNTPTTNWLGIDGKQMEVGRLVTEQHVITYTNLNGVQILRTNLEPHLMIVERFIREDKWVPVPANLRPPPLPQNR